MKYLFLIILLFPRVLYSQTSEEWHHLDPKTDSVLGISTYRAFNILKNKKKDTVIVAVIDNGAELTHDDLKNVFWINSNEIPDNGKDDDKNGYIDDIYGWNFLGNSEGINLKRETTELTRYYSYLKKKYELVNPQIINQDSIEYQKYLNVKFEYKNELKIKTKDLRFYNTVLANYLIADSILKEYFQKSEYDTIELRNIPKNTHLNVLSARDYLHRLIANNLTKREIDNQIKNIYKDLETRLNLNFNPRDSIIGDNPDDISDTVYGNNLINVKGPYHGTGTAGVIGALKNNFGVTGIAQHVKLMILRIVPNGDERDKDVALAIKYAIRNGADIINCSFGKKYSKHPEFVENAIEEAEKKGVLIIIASGNKGLNIDSISFFPSGKIRGKKANNCIIVGASLPNDNINLAAFFSNYGTNNVDIFAPGFNIKSCALNNKYDSGSGTSIAAPVVSGIAAVLKSCYSYLTASQLKEIIMKSAYIPATKDVYLPGSNNNKKDKFENLCVAGGIANLYRAVLLIEKEYLKK